MKEYKTRLELRRAGCCVEENRIGAVNPRQYTFVDEAGDYVAEESGLNPLFVEEGSGKNGISTTMRKAGDDTSTPAHHRSPAPPESPGTSYVPGRQPLPDPFSDG